MIFNYNKELIRYSLIPDLLGNPVRKYLSIRKLFFLFILFLDFNHFIWLVDSTANFVIIISWRKIIYESLLHNNCTKTFDTFPIGWFRRRFSNRHYSNIYFLEHVPVYDFFFLLCTQKKKNISSYKNKYFFYIKQTIVLIE